jgi:hypothetical protein
VITRTTVFGFTGLNYSVCSDRHVWCYSVDALLEEKNMTWWWVETEFNAYPVVRWWRTLCNTECDKKTESNCGIISDEQEKVHRIICNETVRSLLRKHETFWQGSMHTGYIQLTKESEETTRWLLTRTEVVALLDCLYCNTFIDDLLANWMGRIVGDRLKKDNIVSASWWRGVQMRWNTKREWRRQRWRYRALPVHDSGRTI